jgi:hypothetical protein
MDKSKVAAIALRLATDPRFKTWKDLPADFLEETAGLSAEEALELAARLRRLDEERFAYAAEQLLRQHPSRFRGRRQPGQPAD